MEAYTPPPYIEKRPHGRPHRLTPEMRLMVGRKCVDKEMTLREAAKAFGVSHGTVSLCVKFYKNQGLNTKRNERTSARREEIENYHHQGQIKDLKYQIAELFLENQMLKKILHKSQQMKKERGSVITPENLAEYQKDAE